MIINKIVMLLSGIFSLLAVVNILLPEYYGYVVRVYSGYREKKSSDILFKVIAFFEIVYILLGFSSVVPLLFVTLTVYEVIFALFINISKYTIFIIYEFIFLVINLTIFLWLFLD